MVLPPVTEEPLPSFKLDEALDDVPAPSDAKATRGVFGLDRVSESHVRTRPASLPPPNPPKRGPKPVKKEVAARPELELPKIEPKRAVEIPENLAALANAVETYSFSSESRRTAPSEADGEIEIDVEVETEPPNVTKSGARSVEREFDAALKSAGWKAATANAFAAPAVRLDRPFAVLPKLHDMPSTVPPGSGSSSMPVVSIPPQPVPSLPVAPIDLDAEYAILAGKKGRTPRRLVGALLATLGVLGVATALLVLPDVTGEWIEAVRAPLRAPLHDLGIDLPRP